MSKHEGTEFEVVSWQDDSGSWHQGSDVNWDHAFLTTVHFTNGEWGEDWKTVAGPWDDFDAWEDYVDDYIDLHSDDHYFG